jgi:hypothetical protein
MLFSAVASLTAFGLSSSFTSITSRASKGIPPAHKKAPTLRGVCGPSMKSMSKNIKVACATLTNSFSELSPGCFWATRAAVNLPASEGEP